MGARNRFPVILTGEKSFLPSYPALVLWSSRVEQLCEGGREDIYSQCS